MWHLLIITALASCQIAVANPTARGNADGEDLRVGLLCGNYSINVNQSLFIKSKRYAQDYPKNYDCKYTFYCTDYPTSIVFNCGNFVLQNSDNCKKDFLRVYDGQTINDKYCGKNAPKDVATAGNFLGLAFKTNGDSIRKKGFFCRVKCLRNDELTTTTTTTESTTSSSTTSTTTLPTTSTTTVPIITPEEYTGCRCGIPNSPSRIVNGIITGRGDNPWQLAIVRGRLMIPICSGVLLNNQFGITAAHCVHNLPPFEVLLGEYNWLRISSVIKRIPKRTFIHPQFDPTTKVNDLAIIKFDPINLNGHLPISPICLPDLLTDFINSTGIVTGWGKTRHPGFISPVLQEVELPILDPNECTSPDPNILCAGDLSGSKDRCYGDDGGPLSVEVGGRHVLVGITTRKAGCAVPNDPAWFAEIQSHLVWIRDTIADGKGCLSDMITRTTTSTSTVSTTSTSTESTTSTSTESTTSTSTEETSSISTSASTSTTPPPSGLQCRCGIPTTPSNANPPQIFDCPWTVALMSKSQGAQYCSGSPVNSRFILSASSCNTVSMNDIQVRANAQDLHSTTPVRYINRNIVNKITNSDLMLLEMDNPLNLITWHGILTACMPSPSTVFSSPDAEHSGYGLLSSGALSQYMKGNAGSIVPCSTFGNGRDCYQPAQSRGFCGPDKGGPLVSAGPNGRKYLRAIAFDDGNCGQGAQAVARVADYESWIQTNSQTGNNCVL